MEVGLDTVTLKAAHSDDTDLVTRVVERCMRAYAEATWGWWDEAGTRASFDPATHRIIHSGDRHVGVIALSETEDSIHIDKLYVLPEHQNRGIGTIVLRRVMADAKACRKDVQLSVLRVNPARRLYERMGFVVMRTSPERFHLIWPGSHDEPDEPASLGSSP